MAVSVADPRQSQLSPPRARRCLPGAFEAPKYFGSRLLVVILVISAFGPYIFGPVRAEQLVVYGLSFLFVVSFFNLRQWSFGFLVAWTSLILVASLGVFMPYSGLMPWVAGDALAGYDNLFLPLAVMLLIWTLVPVAGASLVLQTAGRALVIASAVNALIAIVSTVVPLDSYLRPFWNREDAVMTVAEAAQTMGRYAGVFGQPAEAGIAYSVAAVLAVWVFAKRPVQMYLLITLIAVGGVLSVSKVFLLIGLPVSLVLLWMTRKGTKKALMVIMVSLLGLVVASASFIQQWEGLDYLTRLLDVPSGVSLIEFYTSGRWNADSSMMTVVESVLSTSPLIGMGASGLTVPYDSQWTETLVVAGVLGVCIICFVFARLWLSFRGIESDLTRMTALAFWVVLVGGSFGISSLTANRVGTIVWVVAALFVAVSAQDKLGLVDSPQRTALIDLKFPTRTDKGYRKSHRAPSNSRVLPSR